MRDGESEFTVDFNLDDEPRSICAFVDRAFGLLQTKVASWHLDLSSCGYIGPDAAAVIVATILQARNCGQTASVTLPTSPPQLAAFCEFSGLRHYAAGTPYPQGDHPQSETEAARQILQSHQSESSTIIDLVRRHVGIDQDTVDYLRICVNEVLQNVEDHASSPIGAVMCARFLTAKKQVRVAIVDRGIGIAASLGNRYSDIRDDCEALRRVVKGGTTARSRPNNMGVGISNLCDIVLRNFRGRMFLISGGAIATGTAGKIPKVLMLKSRFPGTGVFFTIPIG